MNAKQQQLLKAIESLTEDKREAIVWLIRHYKLATALCRECPVLPKESVALEKEAIEKNDMFLLVLVLFERSIRGKKEEQ